MGKARSTLSGYMGGILARDTIDRETWDDLEEALIRADVGVTATTDILQRLHATVDASEIDRPGDLLEALKAQLKADLATGRPHPPLRSGWPERLALRRRERRGQDDDGGQGRQAAGGTRVAVWSRRQRDTFRAAAAEQLETWAERAGADIVRGAEGGDPSSIIFDAVQRAAAKGPTRCWRTRRGACTRRST